MKMRVSSVSYGFTKNLGNFQSMRVDATVDCLESKGDNFDDALALAVAVVHDALDLPIPEGAEELLETERQRASLSQS